MEISFNNVTYIYNEKTVVWKKALDDISVTINPNSIYGIYGPSGSGKTTFIEHINSLLKPTNGTVKVDDYIIKRGLKIKEINKLRFNVGVVFQIPEEQFFNNTVEKEIGFALKYFNYKTKYLHKRVSDALKMVGLDDSYLLRSPYTLSSGEKRKVAIASILIFNPKVIILDEPFVGLDANGKKNLINLIKRLKEKYNKTVIICSHDIDALFQFVDNFIVFNKGKIVFSGERNDLFKQVSIFEETNIKVPKLVEFINKVYVNKGIKLGKTNDINELIKDVYRCLR